MTRCRKLCVLEQVGQPLWSLVMYTLTGPRLMKLVGRICMTFYSSRLSQGLSSLDSLQPQPQATGSYLPGWVMCGQVPL